VGIVHHIAITLLIIVVVDVDHASINALLVTGLTKDTLMVVTADTCHYLVLELLMLLLLLLVSLCLLDEGLIMTTTIKKCVLEKK
jgi:hypothetical protein